mmetsp:Transcript_134818/g.288453  ORF Transcript_134818/g.288453 Transcript_134818/m.288453 type:complete len:208 (-) Transcript_134818:1492-2115(-)
MRTWTRRKSTGSKLRTLACTFRSTSAGKPLGCSASSSSFSPSFFSVSSSSSSSSPSSLSSLSSSSSSSPSSPSSSSAPSSAFLAFFFEAFSPFSPFFFLAFSFFALPFSPACSPPSPLSASPRPRIMASASSSTSGPPGKTRLPRVSSVTCLKAEEGADWRHQSHTAPGTAKKSQVPLSRQLHNSGVAGPAVSSLKLKSAETHRGPW